MPGVCAMVQFRLSTGSCRVGEGVLRCGWCCGIRDAWFIGAVQGFEALRVDGKSGRACQVKGYSECKETADVGGSGYWGKAGVGEQQVSDASDAWRCGALGVLWGIARGLRGVMKIVACSCTL